jgi:hypothetical protein
MTDQEIELSQVLPGPCCGRFVAEPDELERTLSELGIERTDQHPEISLELEEGLDVEGAELESMALLRGMGSRLALPSGTPRHFPPYQGATQRWSERTRLQVMRIRRKAPGIVCATYFRHGRTGEPWGVDIMVAPFRQKANDTQKRLGNTLVSWLMDNFAEMHLNYVIWFNRMNDGAGWFDYTPWSRPASQGGFPGGDPDMNTRRHEDHVHIQVMNPNLGPLQ